VTPAGETSRSQAIYAQLLRLYPRQYLEQHRAEMLQNFLDIEAASSSTVSLWAFICKDLVVSLRTHFRRTFWAQAAITLMVLTVLIFRARGYPVAKEHCIWGFCCGYGPGWLSGWFGKRWQTRSINDARQWVRSFSCQSAMVLGVLALLVGVARGFPTSLEHVLWVLAYGLLLGWSAGCRGKRLHARL
jgi:hypothetical protein